MKLPDLRMNPAVWLGLRQIEAIRESICLSLNGQPLPGLLGDVVIREMKQWLEAQGVLVVDAPESFSGALLPLSFDDAFEKAVGIALPTLVRGSNAPDGSWVNAGAERSGAGWKNPAAFIISSAMVRVLGATEQFELDVLKCLLYYRPSGLLGDSRDWVIQKVDPEVVYETPKKLNDEQLEYVSPPLWTWMKKIAVNNTEREKILKNVFGIVTVKPEDRNKKMGWYKQRNAIVHGRGGVEMTLREYFEVEAFAAKTMLHISEQCFELLKIAL